MSNFHWSEVRKMEMNNFHLALIRKGMRALKNYKACICSKSLILILSYTCRLILSPTLICSSEPDFTIILYPPSNALTYPHLLLQTLGMKINKIVPPVFYSPLC
uniref:Uncharacterized protein n=1 Tax=Cacopsylla melanoneura TaxID=428564 RepID=A0A8D9B6B2_9HEMI